VSTPEAALDGHVAEFAYALHPLPPSRTGLRRWRWELWHGAVMLAAGWRLTRHQAEKAICTAASRRGHQLLGVHALRPERAHVARKLPHPGAVPVDCGGFSCLLVPRRPGALGWSSEALAV
jgi:hypothetical protein